MSSSGADDDRATPNAYAISLEELEGDAHVAPEDTIVEIPGQTVGRAPGDDDGGRRERDALRAGG
jgi:hypothetical protein